MILSLFRQSNFTAFVFGLTSLSLLGCTVSLPKHQSDNTNLSLSESTELISDKQLISKAVSQQLGLKVGINIAFNYRHQQWRFASGSAVNQDGSPLNFDKTDYFNKAREEDFDNIFTALIEYPSNAEQGQLVEFNYGSTDAVFIEWAQRHSLPMCLFSGQC